MVPYKPPPVGLISGESYISYKAPGYANVSPRITEQFFTEHLSNSYLLTGRMVSDLGK